MSQPFIVTVVPPGAVIATLLCIIYASLYHLWGGRSLWDLGFYLLAAGVGFYIGQLLGLVTQVSLLETGQLRIIEGTIGSWLLLLGVQAFRAPG